MSESLETRFYRHLFNFWPCFWGSGGKVTYVQSDWREIRVEIPLTLRTRNYVGTIYGGSMYGAIDPIHMFMLIRLLGDDYVVWDRAGTIHYERPGTTTLEAVCRVEDDDLEVILAAVEAEGSHEHVFEFELVDQEDRVCAGVEKTVYVRRRRE